LAPKGLLLLIYTGSYVDNNCQNSCQCC